MTYTVIVCKNGENAEDLVFKNVHEFWIDTMFLIMNMGDHNITVRDYDGLIIKGDD